MRLTEILLACSILIICSHIQAKQGYTGSNVKRGNDLNKTESLRRALSTEKDPNELISGRINSLVRKEKVVIDKTKKSEDDDEKDITPRTATGGIINTVLVFLCFVAFLGNAIFLYHVFFGKEKVIPLKLVEIRDHSM
jgi:hypothetical protein